MPRPRVTFHRWSAIAVAGVLAALTACTDGPDEQEQLEALDEQIDELGGTPQFTDFTFSERLCVEDTAREARLDVVGALTDASLSGEQDRIEVMRMLLDCVPRLSEIESYTGFFAASLESALQRDVDFDAQEGGCILQYVLDNAEDPAELLVAGSSPDTAEVMFTALEECLDESSMAVVNGEPGTGAQAYGDDPELDSLYDDCVAGDDRACDLLFATAIDGSEYSELAFDCAGRGLDGNTCTEGLIVGIDGEIDEGSPALGRLTVECTEGDMTACDLLFRVAPLGSEIEQIGFTCGGKIAVGAVPSCRARFDE